MSISLEKYYFLWNDIKEEVINGIGAILPYKLEPIEKGFKYLGNWLKHLRYGMNEWWWIIKNFERRIGNWSYRYLSLGGRMIIVRSVLCGILLYCFSLARIPKSIVRRL